jgi:hypothetical protein
MRIRFLLAAAALVLPLSIKAQSNIYTYTGSAFDFSTVDNAPQNPPGTVAAPYSTSDSVTATFTIDGNIDNLNGGFFDTAPYSFNDGVQTLNNSNSDLFVYVVTNGSGDITSYDIGATSSTDLSDFITFSNLGSPGSQGKFDTGSHFVSAETNTFGTISGPVPAPTPEPSSLALLGSGVLGMAFELRRRLRRA